MNFVRAVGDPQGSRASPGMSKQEIIGHARSAVRLNRTVNHPERHIRGDHLDHRNLGASYLITHGVHHVGCLQCEESRLLNLHSRHSDVGHDGPLFGQWFPEGYSGLHPLAHCFERSLGDPYKPHAVVNATRAEPALSNLEPTALTQQHIRNRHAYVLEKDLGMPVRGVVIAKDWQHSLDSDTCGIQRYQYHRLLLV